MDFRDIYYFEVPDVSVQTGTGQRTLFTTDELPMGTYLAFLEANLTVSNDTSALVLTGGDAEVSFRPPLQAGGVAPYIGYFSVIQVVRSTEGEFVLVERNTESPRLDLSSAKLILVNTKPC